MRKIEEITMNIKKNFFAPLASGLGAMRRAAMLLLVMMLTTATAWAQGPWQPGQETSGSCGYNLTWELTGEFPNYTLTITGTGDMYDYNPVMNPTPWNSHAGQISEVVIENGVRGIGSHAFNGCIGLTSIEIPASVMSIGNSVFEGCHRLTSVLFAEGSKLASIGNYAFYLCSNLTSITIPASVENIGDQAFVECSNLATMTVDGENTVYDSRNGCNAIIEKSTNTLIAGCKSTSIPSTVTSIGNNAFHGCSGLTSIEIPATVTSIGELAFYDCSGLTSIEIPASVTSISNNAFLNCSNLATVTVYAPDCTLGGSAFSGCNKLTNIYVFSDLVDNYKAAENWSAYANKITALPTVTTSYVDASGTLHENVQAIPLNNAMTTLPAGTYVVNSDVAYTSGITTTGDVTLILGDGKTMSVTTTDNHECIKADGHSLHIYGQTQGTGTLSAQIQGNADYVIHIEDGTLGIHGGNVNATVGSTETYTAIFLIRHNAGDAFIIDRGTVTANGNTGYGIQGLGGNYCINGGQVIATGASKGISVSTMISSDFGVLILSGGTITASSFYTASEAGGGKYAGSIKVADGHIYYDEDENSYTAGTLTSEQITAIAGKTLRPVTGVTLTKEGSNVSVTFDGTSTTTVNIPVDVEVNNVIYNRTFTANKPSTVMLPFNKDVNEIGGGLFYTFGGVQKENDKWVATMNEVTTGTLTANTPYLFMPTGTSMTFTGGATLNTNGGGNRVTADPGSHWKFKGTYEYMKWTTDTSDPDYNAERKAEIGRTYGFAGVAKTGIEVGDFVKVASGAKIRPMGCYLLWSDEPNASRAAARDAATEELPQSITVRLVSADGEVTGIGEIDTKTGEMTFDSEAWYTLNGVRLSGKPTKKGLYIMNGKKVVVK